MANFGRAVVPCPTPSRDQHLAAVGYSSAPDRLTEHQIAAVFALIGCSDP
jgi:hypothetical protein